MSYKESDIVFAVESATKRLGCTLSEKLVEAGYARRVKSSANLLAS